MSQNGKEGVAIARILADDGMHVVGWLYQWSDGGLGVRWTDNEVPARFVDPAIDTEVIAKAVPIDDAAFIAFLKSLLPSSSIERP